VAGYGPARADRGLVKRIGAFGIGRLDIPEEDALDYVLGYTASNDVSARDMQFLTPQWSFSKGLDGSCPIGKY
jgi:2-keto-4-pentenoate hydratase/2-oxohepta-3-ene-1,7-dioic acid hydratase in catechol pathway